MKILIDTNILISAVLFPNSRIAKVVIYVSDFYEIVLTQQIIEEFRRIINKKFSSKIDCIEELLNELDYELLETNYLDKIKMRDPNDEPILNAALSNDVDFILTGDNDFLCLKISKPRCVNVNDLIEILNIKIKA